MMRTMRKRCCRWGDLGAFDLQIHRTEGALLVRHSLTTSSDSHFHGLYARRNQTDIVGKSRLSIYRANLVVVL